MYRKKGRAVIEKGEIIRIGAKAVLANVKSVLL